MGNSKSKQANARQQQLSNVTRYQINNLNTANLNSLPPNAKTLVNNLKFKLDDDIIPEFIKFYVNGFTNINNKDLIHYIISPYKTEGDKTNYYKHIEALQKLEKAIIALYQQNGNIGQKIMNIIISEIFRKILGDLQPVQFPNSRQV